MLRKTGEATQKSRTHEKKLVAKEDIKMTDLLRYYLADSLAAKDCMWRRIKAFNDMGKTQKALESAQLKGKKVLEAQDAATAGGYQARLQGVRGSLGVGVPLLMRPAAFCGPLSPYS